MVLLAPLLLRWRRALPQYQEVVGVGLVHDSTHSSAMVTDSLQICPLANIGLS